MVKVKVKKRVGDEWYINAPLYGNDFLEYVRVSFLTKGFLSQHPLEVSSKAGSAITKLLGIPENQINQELKESLEAFKQALKKTLKF